MVQWLMSIQVVDSYHGAVVDVNTKLLTVTMVQWLMVGLMSMQSC